MGDSLAKAGKTETNRVDGRTYRCIREDENIKRCETRWHSNGKFPAANLSIERHLAHGPIRLSNLSLFDFFQSQESVGYAFAGKPLAPNFC